MIKLINEPIMALSRFSSAGFSPVRLKWRNRDIRIQEVTGRWGAADGQYKIYNFALMGEGDTYYEISFHTRDMTWYIDKMSIEE